MSSPKIVTFHNPLKHPVVDQKTGLKTGDADAATLRFAIPTHEDGSKDEYEVEPGEEIHVAEKFAYGVKVYAPQMVEGPAPKAQPAKPVSK